MQISSRKQVARRTAFRVAALAAGAAALLALTAARKPSLLGTVSGGLWEVSRSVSGANPMRLCAPEPALLAQFEHRSASCTRVVISDDGDTAVIHYTCAGGGFGRTRMTLITPRSLRLESQGISGGYPFGYTLHARMVGPCRAR